MIKLYRRQDDKVVAYHEAWVDGSHIVEHWGFLGERGKTVEHPLEDGADEDACLKRILAGPRTRGFEPIDDDDHSVLLIEYPVDGMGNENDLKKRHALQDRMDETLGWTGLGHCDGGSIGSGSMEVCCLVVDFDAAKRVIEQDLKGTEFADFSRIYDEEVG